MAGPAYIDVFRKINVQPDNIDVTADSVSDTLTLAAGFGISFVVDAASDRITIVNTGKGTNAASEINDTNSDATYYPVLTRMPGPSDINYDDVPPSYQMDTVYLDGTTTPMTYNPATGTLTSVKYAGTADLTELKLTSTKIALGSLAGVTTQGTNAVAIGTSAGNTSQGNDAIAIGSSAGNNTQGNNAIAIGNLAGTTNQTAGSIILNASGSALESSQAGFYVKPIRSAVPTNNFAFYNTTTNELTYSSFTTEGKTYYVSKNGSDTATGGNIFSAFATLAKALTVATAGDIIRVSAGEYTETFPLTVPAGVTVKGMGLRATSIKPTTATKNKDCFLLNGETTIEDLTVKDMFYDGVGNTGYAFRFAADASITSRSPYIQRVTVFNKGTNVTASDPYGFVSGDAGRGVYLDGSQVTRASLEAAMLFNECTFIVPNSRALIMTNGARSEWLNCFTYFADLAVEGKVGTTGRGGDGKTYLQLEGVTGTFAAGNTISLYSPAGAVVASATIESVSGTRITLDGSVSGFVTNTDRSNKPVIANGTAQLSALQKKFGATSLVLDGTTAYITIAAHPDFAFGASDYTIETWVYRNNATANQYVFDLRTAGDTTLPLLYFAANTLTFATNSTTRISGTVATIGSWIHVAVARQGSNTRLFVNGTQLGTTWVDSTNFGQGAFTIGASYISTSFFNGYIDEFRVSKGVARYTANFTAPTAAFVGDSASVLLLHFNGTAGSTAFLDDGVTTQDIRSSAGGTATGITRYDRAEFAAELRAIAGANIYGNQGVKADGIDVKLHLMAHNFAYIGTGYDLTNNVAAVNQANEVIELNNGKVFYNSVDQNGNYRIGDLFEVNFETGAVTFTGSNFDVSSLSGITFTDGTNNTVINPTTVQTGNLVLAGNTLSAVAGGITLDPSGVESISLNGNTSVTGTFSASGHVTLEGVTATGATGTGDLVFNASPTISGATLTTATSITFASGASVTEFSTDDTLGGASPSSTVVPVESAVKGYADSLSTYVGTTSIAITRASAEQALTGITGISTTDVTSANSSAISIATGTTTTSGTTGAVTLKTGNSVATSGNLSITTGDGVTSGNITIDVGNGSTTDGTISIGTTYASTVSFPSGKTKVGVTTLTQGVDGSITLPASTGTLALNNQTFNIGTTSIAINRASAEQSLTGISGFSTSNATSANSTAISIATGTTTTSGTTGAVTISSGNSAATSGDLNINTGTGVTSGNINIDVGNGSTTDGNINIGSTNAATVNLPTGKTKIGTSTLAQGAAFTYTLPTVTANSTLYGSGGGDVALGDGGTGASLSAVNGGIVYSTASAMAITTAGTANQILASAGAAAPTWTSFDFALHAPDSSYKKITRVATTGANITLSAGAPNTLDGITLAANDRILVKDQTTPAQNGIYIVQTLGTGANGTWVRAGDADSTADIDSSTVAVSQGNTNGGRRYTTTFKGTDTLGTTAMYWNRVADIHASSYAPLQTTGVGLDLSVGGDAVTMATGAVTNLALSSFTGRTINAVAASTYTTASTVYIASAPTQGTNATFTSSQAYSLYVAGGKVRIAAGVLFDAGTATVAPIQLTSGTNLTTPVAGGVEYDGTAVYVTTNATHGRGVVPSLLFTTGAGTTVATPATATNYPIFPAAGDTLSVVAATYRIRGTVNVICAGATSNSLNFDIKGAGTAVIASMAITVDATNTNSVSVQSGTTTLITGTGGQVAVTAAVATATNRILSIEGIIRITTAGTLIPSISFTGAPGGQLSFGANNYIEMYPIGNNTVAESGTWA